MKKEILSSKFKYFVIVDNTKDNRDWLIKLGYIPLKFFLDKKYIYTNFSNRADSKEEWKEYYFETHDDIKSSIGEINYINCIGDNNLFRSVSALRDDIDYMQWFITPIYPYGRDWFLCKSDSMPKLEEYTELRKATLEELLIKHQKYD